MHFLLTYDYTDDYLEKRGLYRNAHLAHAWAAQQRGEVLLAGAVGSPPASAVLVFQCESADTLEQFAQTDPYYLNGLVRRYTVAPWTTVVGAQAHTPIYPEAETAQKT